MFCPKCGAENPDEARFCGHCAKRLPVEAEAQSAGLSPPPPSIPSPPTAPPPAASQPSPAPTPPASQWATQGGSPQPGAKAKSGPNWIVVAIVALVVLVFLAALNDPYFF